MRFKASLFLLVTTIAFSFCGCGGSGGTTSSGGTNNQSLSGNIISGVASKGIIVNGKINIYSLTGDGSKGIMLATATTDINGEYAASVGSYTGPILVEASGGYTDEATGQPMTIAENLPLRAAYANVTGSAVVAITPFTEMAVRIACATSLIPANISKANDLITGVFPFDAINTKPLAVTVTALQAATQAQRDYSLALAVLSQMAKNSGVSVAEIIDTMKTDIINHNTLTTAPATGFINALHDYLDNNSPIKQVVRNTGGSALELIGSATLPVNSMAVGPDGTLYAGINAFTKYSSAKINTFKSYSSVSVYKLAPSSNRWELFGKITNAVNSSWSKLIVDPSDSSELYAGFDRALFKSSNSGQNWSTLGNGNIGLLENIAIDSSSIVYVATLSSLVKSNYFNGSLYWYPISNGLPFNTTIYTIAIDPSDSNILYAGGHNGTLGTGIYKSTNAGSSWVTMNTGLTFTENGNIFLPDISSIAIDPTNTSTIYAASYNPNGTVFKSINGGGSWSAIINGNAGNIIGDRFLKVTVDPNDTLRVYVIGINGLYYSQDGGITWITSLTTANFTRIIWDLVVVPNNNTLYAMYSGGILQGTFSPADHSLSWSILRNRQMLF